MALGEVPRNEPTWFPDERVAAKPLHALGFSKGTSRSRRVRSFVLFHFSVTTESHGCLGQCCPICKAMNLCYAHRHCVPCLGWPLAPQNTQRGKPLKQGDHTVGSSFLWTVVAQTGKPAHGPHMLASGVFVEENEESHLRQSIHRLHLQRPPQCALAILSCKVVLLLVTRTFHCSTLKQFRLLGMPLPLQAWEISLTFFGRRTFKTQYKVTRTLSCPVSKMWN